VSDYATAYRALEDAALAHTKGDLMTGRDLVKASLAHAAAHALEAPSREQRPAPQKPPETPAAAPTTFPPFGRGKGQPIRGAAIDTLRFHEAAAVRSLANVMKRRWHRQEQALLDAVRAELRRQGQAADHG
jgi:hypothetical protein